MQTIKYDSEKKLFQNNNTTELRNHFSKITEPVEIDLQDFFAQTEKNKIQDILISLFDSLENEFELKIQMPHPRHDAFLKNLNYSTALLPEALIASTKKMQRSSTAEVTMALDPEWQKAIDEKEVSLADIDQIAKQANNVIQSYSIHWKVKKKGWAEVDAEESENMPLTPDMIKQLQEQLELAKKRNDLKTVESIQGFLNKNK